MQPQIQALLDASPEPHAEERAIHDHEGFGDYPVSEHDDLCAMAALIEEHGPIVATFVTVQGVSPSEAQEPFADAYQGAHSSLEAWAEQSFEDLLEKVPEALRGYIAFDRPRRGAGR